MTDTTDPALMSLEAVAAAIRDGRVSSVAATEACLARIDAHETKVNSIINLERQAVLEAARAADEALARGDIKGPLHGVPLAHKDMYYRKGHISTCGSKIRRNYTPDVTATVLQRLEDAGALYLGGLNMAEFAAGPTGHNEHFGDCRNPWNRDHITGGSSSGSGASTAARFVYGAMGSDTGGSVRLPAALCGVAGLKPTYGRISRYGTMPRAWSNDTMGPLARSVRDCALMTQLIAGQDPDDPTTPDEPVPDYLAAIDGGIEGLRVAVPANFFYDDIDDTVRERLEASVDVLREQGVEIVEARIPDLTPLFRLGDVISKSEAATIHAKWMRQRPQDYGHHTAVRVEAGFHIPATRYLEALSLRSRFLREFLDTALADADMLHTPTIPMPVPTIAETAFDGTGGVGEMVARMTMFTRPINYMGLPSLTVPCGFTKGDLPVAFQLVGRPFGEAQLFAMGATYQAATDWHTRVPAL
jgi:aspartyl-tRNA(Asn)/glutamyl-tRNA(Gln) amidotransferase subunit A